MSPSLNANMTHTNTVSGHMQNSCTTHARGNHVLRSQAVTVPLANSGANTADPEDEGCGGAEVAQCRVQVGRDGDVCK